MNKKAVLILAPEDDLHARAVQQQVRARADVDCFIVDAATFPATTRLEAAFRTDGPSARLVLPSDGVTLPVERIGAVWRRRIHYASPPDSMTDPGDRLVAENDSRHALNGLLFALQFAGVRMVNDPTREAAANNKLYQLAQARQLGLRIPQTVVTNDPERVRAFQAELARHNQRLVYKGLTQPRDRMVSTQLLDDADLAELDSLQLAPVIFQEYCPGRNLRVIVVGQELFVGEVSASSPETEVDWRLEVFNPIQPCALSSDQAALVLQLMSALDLVYGALDFKVLPSGELVFLEVNPAGQFLFVEIRAGLPISAAVARLLARGCSAARKPPRSPRTTSSAGAG